MVNQQKVIEILRNIGETIEKEKLFLTELDNVIGDGELTFHAVFRRWKKS